MAGLQRLCSQTSVRVCLCICISVCYVLTMKGRGEGGGNGGEYDGERRKNPTSFQEMRIYSFKALGCVFTFEISHLPFSFLSFAPIFISLHPPAILHISRHFTVFSLAYLSQRRRPEMNPLSCIIYPQSKSL